jgi:hypothetical protein
MKTAKRLDMRLTKKLSGILCAPACQRSGLCRAGRFAPLRDAYLRREQNDLQMKELPSEFINSILIMNCSTSQTKWNSRTTLIGK